MNESKTNMSSTPYTIRRVATPPPVSSDWNHPAWDAAEIAEIASFHPKSSDHRPQTRVRALIDGDALFIQFRVQDRFVRSVQTEFMAPVCSDSCVEFFFQPNGHGPYFNFEANAGGTLLASCVRDPQRLPEGGFTDWAPLRRDQARQVAIVSSLPRVIDPEIETPVTWSLCMRIPLNVLSAHNGEISTEPGAMWRGNFYKCGDRTSHPHWASWSPIGPTLNFHQPDFFAPLAFSNHAPQAKTS